MDSPAFYLLVGLLACFIGTIPFGPINLAVVKTTVENNPRRGLEIALAASVVEIAEALVAILFGMLISDFLDSNRGIKLGIGLAFIALAVVVYTRSATAGLRDAVVMEGSYFLRGVALAALNPQAIPFWIFALATISQYVQFNYTGVYLVGFLLGVFAGKMLALSCFVIASSYLKAHLQQSSKFVNYLLAAILLLIGLSQLWNAVTS